MRTAKPDHGEQFRHMDHVVNLLGIDHVDFGPDWIVNMTETAIGMQSPLGQMFFDDNGYSILQDLAAGKKTMMFRSVHTVFKPPVSGGAGVIMTDASEASGGSILQSEIAPMATTPVFECWENLLPTEGAVGQDDPDAQLSPDQLADLATLARMVRLLNAEKADADGSMAQNAERHNQPQPLTLERKPPMSDLAIILFKDQTTAFEMRAALAKMQQEYLIDMEDVVVVTKDAQGKVKLHQAVNLTAAGASGGGFWGLLIGMLFLNPLLGIAVGAGAGALAGKLSDIGINDQMMKGVAAAFQPGTSALFVLVRKATGDKVLAGLKPFAGKATVLQTSLRKDSEEALRAVLEQA